MEGYKTKGHSRLFRNGFNRIVQGEIVHHIIEIKSDWNKRFDINNLFFLTKENHNKVHSKMNVSNEMQYEVIKMLKDFKIKFKEEFGV